MNDDLKRWSEHYGLTTRNQAHHLLSRIREIQSAIKAMQSAPLCLDDDAIREAVDEALYMSLDDG